MALPAVRMTGITKRFPGVVANDHIDFDVWRNKINVLVGENAAGKTTLMNVLFGLYKPDEGEILINGKKSTLRSPRDAINLKICMIHQHFKLIPAFTVTENVALVSVLSGKGIFGLFKDALMDLNAIEKRIASLSEEYGLKVDPKAKIEQLSVGEQQRVEIIKAIYQDVEVLIMDEPTAVLTPQEVVDLFRFLKAFGKEGRAIVFITHKLDEVMSIGDIVTVIKAGRVVATKTTTETDKNELARLMVGRDVIFRPAKGDSSLVGNILRVENLEALNDRGIKALKSVTLSIRGGEILGIAGVSGNGQKELAEVIMGLRKATKGNVFLEDDNVTNCPPFDRGRIKHSVGYIPEDRLSRGLILDFSIRDNAILGSDLLTSFTKNRILLDYKNISKHAKNLVSSFDVKTTGIEAIARTLSGGNLQKLILARELSRKPRLLIACDPTRGLDVGATEFVRQKLLDLRKDGVATLLISEDLDEILSMSDFIAVIFEGEIMKILSGGTVDIEEMGLLMAGVRKNSESSEGSR